MAVQRITICKTSDLSENQAAKFVIKGAKYDREGVAIHQSGKYLAYYNECTHISLALDWNDNDFYSADFKYLVCKNHGAHFDPLTGRCEHGPSSGAFLKSIPVEIESIANDEFLVAIIELTEPVVTIK